MNPPGALAGNIVRFTRILRTAGIPIGTDKVMDAVRVLPIAGIERRADCHATLSALFLTRREQQPVFDEAFARFWAPPEAVTREQVLKLPKVAGPLSQPPANPGRVREALMPLAADLSRQDAAPDTVEIDAALTFSPGERLQALDFERMTADEWEETRRAISRLRLPLPRTRLRRFRAVDHGPSIDLGRTLRRMARDGGDLTRLAHRARVERMPPLVVLCDISGSMHRYTRMFLHFVHAIARDNTRVSAFLFGTRITNVSRALRDRDVDDALARMSSLVPDWAGGTRIGACLREFNYRWSRRLLGQNACVLLVSDGLDRDDAQGLSDEMARLHRSCRRLLWLNPLLRYDGFEPSASGIASMLPHVDAFLPVHNLASLRQLASALDALPARPSTVSR